jgi:hypothetical protein
LGSYLFLEAVMHTTTLRSAEQLGFLDDKTPWRIRFRSFLSRRRHRTNEEPKNDSLDRLDDRLLADVGVYREHRIHHPQNRTDQQPGTPVPAALLAIWMPRI